MMSRKIFQAAQRSTTFSTVQRLTSQLTSLPPKDIVTTETFERDLVNFPRIVKTEFPNKVYYGLIPEDWFTCFHTKTGVSGPYVFAVGLTTFLCSKEIYVLEHNFYTGLSLFIMSTYTVKTTGAWVAAHCDTQLDEIYDAWEQHQEKSLNKYKDAVDNEKKEQWRAEGQKLLFEAKRLNAAIQLEAEYRQRIKKVHEEITNRLDSEVRSAQSAKYVTQKHLASWVTRKVMDSLDQRTEELCLRECISELMAQASHFQPSELQLPSADNASFWLFGGYRALHCQFQLQFRRPMSLLVVFNRQEDEENKLLKPILVFII